jgi:hypothetical protein
MASCLPGWGTNTPISLVWGSLTEAELTWLAQEISRPVYDALNDYIDDGDSPMSDPDKYEAIRLARLAVANYTLALAYPQLISTVGASGVSRKSSTNTQPLGAWEFYTTREAHLSSADKCLDALLAFLDAKQLTEWVGSISYLQYRGLLVSTPQALAEYVPSVAPCRRLFGLLKYQLKSEEIFSLEPIIGPTQLQELKASLITTPSENAERLATLAELARPYIALKAVYQCVPALAVRIDNEGLKIRSVVNNIKADASPTLDQIRAYCQTWEKEILRHEARLKAWLSANRASLPLYDAFKTPVPNSTPPPTNVGRKSFVL